jgi:quercetin dioxygenase-like cupin family protein
MNLHCVDWTALPEEVAPNKMGKRVMPGTGASLVMVRVPAGTKADRHSHAHEQFVQVLAASGVLETEQGSRAFSPGSVFHFPTNT